MNLIFDNAQSVREACAGTYKSEAALQAAVVAAIAAVIATGEIFTATISISSYGNQDINSVMRMLNEGFFTAVVTGANLIVSW